MRVLVMGGTRFNGLALVHELAKYGHEVTTFNRVQTEAHIPRGVHRLYCERNDHSGMAEVFRYEEFDCIYDISGYTLATSKAWSRSGVGAPATMPGPAPP